MPGMYGKRPDCLSISNQYFVTFSIFVTEFSKKHECKQDEIQRNFYF